jgi:hypothetical protein
MKQKFNTRTTRTRDAPQNAKWSDPELETLNLVKNDLVELLAEGANEEYEIPGLSDAVFRYTSDLIAETGRIMKESFPYGSVSSDGEGGVRIEWRRGDRGVHLAVPANPDESYIYYEEGNDYALDENISASILSTHLAELIRP